MKFTPRDGSIRFYDGAVTPYYLDLDFDNADISFPLGQPRQDEILYLHRMIMDSNAHYVKGSDEKLMGPITCTLSITLTDAANSSNTLNWLKGCNDGGTTQVNSNTIATTKSDTQRDGSNNNPAFADSNKLTFNIECLWNTSGTDMHFALNEVWCDLSDQTIAEADDGVTLNLTGQIYGTIVYTPAGSMTSGTDVEA